MTGNVEKLEILLQMSSGKERDQALLDFTMSLVDTDLDIAIDAANRIEDPYKRGWGLLECIKRLVKVDIDRARETALGIDDEYNKIRASHYIGFALSKDEQDPGLN